MLLVYKCTTKLFELKLAVNYIICNFQMVPGHRLFGHIWLRISVLKPKQTHKQTALQGELQQPNNSKCPLRVCVHMCLHASEFVTECSWDQDWVTAIMHHWLRQQAGRGRDHRSTKVLRLYAPGTTMDPHWGIVAESHGRIPCIHGVRAPNGQKQ